MTAAQSKAACASKWAREAGNSPLYIVRTVTVEGSAISVASSVRDDAHKSRHELVGRESDIAL